MYKLNTEKQLANYYHNEEKYKKVAYTIYNDIILLRKNIDIIKYNKLKELNKNDIIYSFAFNDNDVLKEDIEELKESYNYQYIYDILNVYKEILQVIQK